MSQDSPFDRSHSLKPRAPLRRVRSPPKRERSPARLREALGQQVSPRVLMQLQREGPDSAESLYLQHLLRVQQATGLETAAYLPWNAPPSWTRWIQPHYRLLWAHRQQSIAPAPESLAPAMASPEIAAEEGPTASAHSATDSATDSATGGEALAVQRLAGPGGLEEDEALEDWFQRTLASAAPGRSPTPREQRFLRQVHGRDMPEARIHEGGASREMAAAVSARAFTVGRDIFLPGGADLSSPEGAELLAHEATHVAQAGEARLPGTSAGGLTVSDPAQSHEREAAARGRAGRRLAGSSASGAVDPWGFRQAPIPDSTGEAILQLLAQELPAGDSPPPAALVDSLLAELSQDRLVRATRRSRAALESQGGGLGSGFARQVLSGLEGEALEGAVSPGQIARWSGLTGAPEPEALASFAAEQAPWPGMAEAMQQRLSELGGGLGGGLDGDLGGGLDSDVDSGGAGLSESRGSGGAVMRLGGGLMQAAAGAVGGAVDQAVGSLQSALPPQVSAALGALRQLVNGGPQQLVDQLLDAAGVDPSLPGIREHIDDIRQAVGQVAAPALEQAVAAGESSAEEGAAGAAVSGGGGLGGALGGALGQAAESVPGVGDASSALEGATDQLDGLAGDVMGQLDVNGLSEQLSGALADRLGDVLPESVRGLLSQGLAESANGLLEQATGGAGGGGGIGGAIGDALGGAAGGEMPDVGGALEGLTESLPDLSGLMAQAQGQLEGLVPESVSGALDSLPGVDEIWGLLNDPGALTDRLLSQVGELASLPEVMQNWTEIQQVVRDVAVPDLTSAVTAGESAANSAATSTSESTAGSPESASTSASGSDTASAVQTAIENRLDPETLAGPLWEALDERLGGVLPAGVLDALSGDLAGGAQALVGQAFGVLGSLGGDIPGVGGLLSRGQEALGGLFRSARGNGAMEPGRARSEMARSGSRPLPDEVAAQMGTALGEDLSGVRVHADAAAARASEALDANAFAAGSDLYFGAGRFSPTSAAGEHLLAHELAHVAQAARGGGAEGVSRPGDPAEREAEAAADQIVAGGAVEVSETAASGPGGPAIAEGVWVFGEWIFDEHNHAIRDNRRMTIPPDKDTLASEIGSWCDEQMTDSRAQSLVRASISFDALWTQVSAAVGGEVTIVVELVRDEQGVVRLIRVSSPDVVDMEQGGIEVDREEQEEDYQLPDPPEPAASYEDLVSDPCISDRAGVTEMEGGSDRPGGIPTMEELDGYQESCESERAEERREDVIRKYTQAYDRWWATRPERFRNWGLGSNARYALGDSDSPVCFDYAQALVVYLNQNIDIPDSYAYTEPTSEVNNGQMHWNVTIFYHGVVIETFDPWWRIPLPESSGLETSSGGDSDGASRLQLKKTVGGFPRGMKEQAARGVTGSGLNLPYLARIQEAFGGYDISGVRAHTGGAARDAAQSIGASAYATGEDVAFAGTPDLHTVAHEAAHVIQQRSGVSLSGGVGKVGDAYEQHSDRVADVVVGGGDAEALLNSFAQRGAAMETQSVQLHPEEELQDRTEIQTFPASSYDVFEGAIHEWLSRIVRSRSEGADGQPVEREQSLVEPGSLQALFRAADRSSGSIEVQVQLESNGYSFRRADFVLVGSPVRVGGDLGEGDPTGGEPEQSLEVPQIGEILPGMSGHLQSETGHIIFRLILPGSANIIHQLFIERMENKYDWPRIAARAQTAIGALSDLAESMHRSSPDGTVFAQIEVESSVNQQPAGEPGGSLPSYGGARLIQVRLSNDPTENETNHSTQENRFGESRVLTYKWINIPLRFRSQPQTEDPSASGNDTSDSPQGQSPSPAPIQQRGIPGAAKTPGTVHEAAARGISASGESLPHLDRLQESFGQHDLSGVRAHLGSRASEAVGEMGASAYATGEDVAFGSTPDLHTAAHEAAHVIQQRSGVSLQGGISRIGDVSEQHADRVANEVVSGKNVENLLSDVGLSSGSIHDVVQGDWLNKDTGEELSDEKYEDRFGTDHEPGSGWEHIDLTPNSANTTCGDRYAAPGAIAVTGGYDYYTGRNDDFSTRYASDGLTPPTYYLNYGGKYNLRFNNNLRPRMTSAGQTWLDATSIALQNGIENERASNPEHFDCLEKDDAAFTAFAYGTHADAYLYSGLENLNPFDLAMIGTTPDVQDLFTSAGMSQAVETGLRLLPYWGANLGLLDHSTAYLIDQFVRSGRPEIEEIVGVVHTIADQHVVQPIVNFVDGYLGTGATEFIANEARVRLQDATESTRDWIEEGLQSLGLPVPW